MKKLIIKYNLEILSVYTLAMLGVLVAFWSSFSLVQRITVGFLELIMLHEWEETRFPGGFFEMMGGIMKVDMSKAPAEYLHLPVTVFIVLFTLLPLLFPKVAGLFLSLMILGLFEGLVHIAGIKLGRKKKPYTPGMISGEVLLVYAVIGIYLAVSMGLIAPLDWLLGIMVFAGGFVLMETGVYRVLGLKYTDVLKHMRANMKGTQP